LQACILPLADRNNGMQALSTNSMPPFMRFEAYHHSCQIFRCQSAPRLHIFRQLPSIQQALVHRQHAGFRHLHGALCISSAADDSMLESPANKADAAITFLQQQGLSNAEASTLLHKYPSCAKWDVQTRLQPAFAQWKQELGIQQFAKTLGTIPKLFAYSTSSLHVRCAWLASIGVQQPRTLFLHHPYIATRSLESMQSKVMATVAAGNS